MRQKSFLKHLLITTICLALLAGCGKAEEPANDPSPQASTTAQSEEEEPPADPGKDIRDSVLEHLEREKEMKNDKPAGPADAFRNFDAENNGNYFVRVGDKVYYRVFNKSCLERTNLWGQFTEKKTEAEASLMCFDLNTGEKEAFASTAGMGKLFAFTEGFLLAEPEAYESILITPDGEEIRSYLAGTPVAVSEDGRSVVTIDYSGDPVREVYRIYLDGSLSSTFSAEADTSCTVFGFTGDYLLVMESDYTVGDDTLVSYDSNGTRTELGMLDSDYMRTPQCEQILRDGETTYVMVAYYEGTGHFLADYEVYRIDPGKAGAMSVMETDHGTMLDYPDGVSSERVPVMYLDNGNMELCFHPAGAIDLSVALYGDLLYYDAPDHSFVISESFINRSGYDDSSYTVLNDAVAFGNDAFVIRTFNTRNEAGDIGWRYAYDLQEMDFFHISFNPDDPYGEDHLEEYLDVLYFE